MPYPLLLTLACILLFAVLRRLHSLERENKQLHARGGIQKKHSEKEGNLSEAPFASCVVQLDGKVTWANQAYWKLSSENTLATLTDLNRWAGTELLGKDSVVPFNVSSSTPGARLHFSAMNWPLPGKAGHMISFFEQTGTKQRHQHVAGFEAELIRYTSLLAASLHELANHGGHFSSEALATLAFEATELSRYATELHTIARRVPEQESFDLSKLVRSVLRELEPDFRKRHIHLLLTAAPQALVRANQGDFQIALHLIITTCIEQTPLGGTFRLDIRELAKQTRLSIQLPELHLTEHQSKYALAFGHTDPNLAPLERIWRFKLAIAHQITLKYHAQLHLESNEHEGTLLTLTSTNGPTKHKAEHR